MELTSGKSSKGWEPIGLRYHCEHQPFPQGKPERQIGGEKGIECRQLRGLVESLEERGRKGGERFRNGFGGFGMVFEGLERFPIL